MTATLKIYVRMHCSGCEQARATASHITTVYPHVDVEIVDMDNPDVTIPNSVFATPTYVLDNRIVSLGNPNLDDVATWLTE